MSDDYGVLYRQITVELNAQTVTVPVAVIDAPKKVDLSDYTVPSHVAVIEPYAFAYNETLENVDLSYVMTVEKSAFYGATALKSVHFNVPQSDDEYVKILEDLVKTEQFSITQIIGDRAFYGCTALKEADLSGASVLSIGNDAFGDCGGSIQKIVIGESVKSIGDGAFGTRTGSNATAIGWIQVDDSNEVYLSIDGVLYRRLADKTRSLVTYPIAKRSEMGAEVYAESFETPAFDEQGTAVTVSQIEDGAFAYVRYLKELTLGDSVVLIGTEAFAHSALMRVHIGSGVIKIGSKPESNPHEVFLSCGALEAITVDEANPCFTDLDGVLYEYAKDDEGTLAVTTLIKYPVAKDQSEYLLPKTVLNVLPKAFEDADNLKKVTVTSVLRSVGENAFVDCSSLSTIYFKGVSAPKFVGLNAFTTYDLSLTEAFDPRTVVYYDDQAYDEEWAQFIEFRSCNSCGSEDSLNHNGFHFACYEDYTLKQQGEYYTLVVVDKMGNPINDVYVSLTDLNGVEISKPTIGGIVTVVDQYDEYGSGFDVDFDSSYALRVVDNRGEYFPLENPEFYMDEEMRITYLALSSVPTVSAVSVSYEVDGSKIKDLLTGVASEVVLGEGKKTADINSESVTINKWCVDSMEVLILCGLDHDATVSGYQVLQGEKVVLSATAPALTERVTNGKRTASFSVTLPTENLLAEEDLCLILNVLDGSGALSKVQTQLKIKIIELDFKALDFSFLSLGEGQTLSVDPKLEEIFKGFGKELPLLSKWNIEVAIEIKADSFRIAIGGGSERKNGGGTRPEESLSSGDFADFFKQWSVYKDGVKNSGGVTKTPFSCDKQSTVEKRITGFLEINYKGLTAEGHQDFEVVSGVTGSIGFTKEFGATYYFVFVPVRLEAELSAEGSLTFMWTFDYEAEQFITPGIEVQFEGGITLQGGVGFRFASVGFYGSLKMLILVQIAPELELKEWSAEGDLGFYVEYDGLFVKWKYTHSFVNGKLYIYKDGAWFTAEGSINNLSYSQLILNESSYVLAESAGREGANLSSLSAQAVEDAYEQSGAKCIRAGDRIYIFYYADLYALGYSEAYDSYNYQKLVYQIYDLESQTLSEATVLDDNGYADGSFAVSLCEDKVVVLFAQLKEKMTAEHAEDVAEYLSSIELKTAYLDGENVVVAEKRLTDNSYYELFPVLERIDGKTVAVWAENKENTLFCTTENNGIALYKSFFDGASWSSPVCIKEGIGSIADLAVCGDSIGYITDDNNDLGTIGEEGEEGYNDRRIRIIDLDGNDLSVSEHSDSYHDLSVMGDGFVYYLGASLYTQEGDLILASTQDHALPQEYTVLNDTDGKPKAILFISADRTQNASNLYGVFYDTLTDSWGAPVRITNYTENTFVNSFDAVDLGKQIYLAVTYSCENEDGARRSILEKCVYDYPEGVKVEAVDVEEDKTCLSSERGSAYLALKITNEGYRTLTSLPVRVIREDACLLEQTITVFFDENGMMLEGGLPSGETGYVQICFEEYAVDPHTYTVWAGKSDCSVKIWYSDLQIYGKQVAIGENRYIIARVYNAGLLTSKETVLWVHHGGKSDQLTVESLKSGEECCLQIPIEQEQGSILLQVASEDDSNVENNEALILVSNVTEEERSTELLQILESTELRVDLLAPTMIYLPFDSSYALEEIVIGEKGYDCNSGLFSVEADRLMIDGALVTKLCGKGTTNTCYRLTGPDGQSVEATALLTVYASYRVGDVNGDGWVRISDVTVLLNYLAASDEQKQAMISTGKVISSLVNVNNDASVSISDVTRLLNILAGIV